MANKRERSVQWSLRLYLLPSAIPVQPVRRLGEMFPAPRSNVQQCRWMAGTSVLEPVVMRYKVPPPGAAVSFVAMPLSAGWRWVRPCLAAEGLLSVMLSSKRTRSSQRDIAHRRAPTLRRSANCPTMFDVSIGPALALMARRMQFERRSACDRAKVEWHPSELVPRVGFIVTNLSGPTKRVVAFYNHRGTAAPVTMIARRRSTSSKSLLIAA